MVGLLILVKLIFVILLDMGKNAILVEVSSFVMGDLGITYLFFCWHHVT